MRTVGRMSLGIALVIAATSIQASVMPAVSSAEAPMPPKPNRALGIAEASPLPELLPDESRTPLQADLTEEAAVVPDVPKVRIRPDGTLPPGLEVDPHRSGRNFVAYRSAEDHQQHVAKVFTRDVNFRNPSGKWQRLRLQTVPQRGGWQARTGIDEPATVALPARLGGVTWSSDEGTVVTELQGLADVRGRRAGLSVRYGSVATDTDVVYTVTSDGYKEEVWLGSASAKANLRWSLQTDGVSLAADADGAVNVLDAKGAPVAQLSDPIISDAAGAQIVGTYVLAESGSGYVLDLDVDADFLASATYPVVVDPGVHDNNRPADFLLAGRNTYVDSSCGSCTYDSSNVLRVGSSPARATYLQFDTSPYDRDGRLIYSAIVGMYKTPNSEHDNDVAAERILEPWGAGPISWDSRPAAGAVIDGHNTQENGVSTWEMKELFQHWIKGVPGLDHWDNNGMRFVKASGAALHEYYSTRAFDSQDPRTGDPFSVMSWNDLPGNPTLGAPDAGVDVETESPTLRVDDIPNDVNGDKVYIRFQISDDGQNWDGGHLVHQSGWLKEEKSYVVPGGVLIDGQRYWWRAQSWDGYDLTDGAGNVRTEPTSPLSRSFRVTLKHWGSDERWSMWSQTIGNNVGMNVNEANGNLVLEVPMISVITPADDLSVGLSYNHQQDADYGMGAGWDLAIGPASSRRELPTGLEKVAPFGNGGGVKIRFKGGRVVYFPHLDGNVYASMGAGAGEVRRVTNGNEDNSDDEFLYRAPSGGRYVFGNGGRLLDAKPAWTDDTVVGKSFTYEYEDVPTGGTGPARRLVRVRDALGRAINLTWSQQNDPRLQTISLWGGRTWNLNYSAGQLITMINPEGDRVEFVNGSGGRVSMVRDGRASFGNDDGWDIEYITDPAGTRRVSAIRPPTAPADTFWAFEYPTTASDYRGTTAAWTRIIDPRGTSTSDPNDYLTRVEFNWAGMPIRRVGAADQLGERPISTTVYDSNLNIICKRDAVANAVALGAVANPTKADNEQPCLNESLTSTFDYQGFAPFQMTKSVGAAPNADGTGGRQRETFEYDEGMHGLWAETYNNAKMLGQPANERLWNEPLNEDWNTGSPPSISQNNDWSIRWTGMLDLRDKVNTKDYEFKVWSNDGVSVTIGNKSIVDCFGKQQAATDPSHVNCGKGSPVEKTLTPKLHPITIEYSELDGGARFEFRWDQGIDVKDENAPEWQVLPSARLLPNLGLLTSMTSVVDYNGAGDTDNLVRKTVYDYPNDESMARRLPQSESIRADGGGQDRTTNFTYDRFGRVLSSTVGGVRTAQTYDNGSTLYATNTTCNSKTQVQEQVAGTWTAVRTTNRECNNLGEVTKETLKVPAVAGTLQAEADRVSETIYDGAGRVLSVNLPTTLGIDQQYTYNRSGQTETETKLIKGSSDPAQRVYAVTRFFYDALGRVSRKELPATGVAASANPFPIYYSYDWVGNALTESDPRYNGAPGATDRDKHFTATCYDAENRVISIELPDPDGGAACVASEAQAGLTTTTVYHRRWINGGLSFKNVQTSSAGVATTSTYNMLGKLISEKVGAQSPRLIEYDEAGNVKQVTEPDPNVAATTVNGAQTRYVLNVHGDVTHETKYPGTSSQATTANYYDDLGRLWKIDGPQANDEVEYTFDALGNITKVSQPGVPLPGSTTRVATTNATFNAASEQIKLVTAMTATQDFVRQWAYDDAGRIATFQNARGSTAYTYNAAGWMTKVDDPRVGFAMFGYDNAGRRVERWYDNGSGVISDKESTSYDALGNAVAAKTWTGTTETSSVVSTYDASNRLASVTTGASPTSYSFNAAGQVSSVADAAGTTSLTYDTSGRVATVDEPIGTGLSTITYDDAGRMTSRTDGTALAWTRTYEPGTGRLDTQTIKKGTTTVQSTNLDYTLNGNVQQRTQTVFNGTANVVDSWGYTYDAANRVKTATLQNATGGTVSTAAYQYDGAGNRTVVTKTVGTSAPTVATTTYDAASQPLTTVDPSGTTKYVTDEVGSITKVNNPGSQVDWQFTYDGFTRMRVAVSGSMSTSDVITKPTATINYTVDGLDRVRSKAKGSTTTSFLYRGESEDIAKMTVGSTTTTYTYAQGAPAAQKTGTTSRLFMRDLHGDVLGMTDTTGAVKGTTTYDPFGEKRAVTGEQSSLGFQGDMTDPDTTLVDMGTRYYLPKLGRFTTRDVLMGDLLNPMSLNQFAYGLNNPVTMWDPTGMAGCPSMPHNSCAPAVIKGEKQRQQHEEQVAAQEEAEEATEPAPIPPPVARVLIESGFSEAEIEFLAATVATATAAPDDQNLPGPVEYLVDLWETGTEKALEENLKLAASGVLKAAKRLIPGFGFGVDTAEDATQGELTKAEFFDNVLANVAGGAAAAGVAVVVGVPTCATVIGCVGGIGATATAGMVVGETVDNANLVPKAVEYFESEEGFAEDYYKTEESYNCWSGIFAGEGMRYCM